jgi:hypothetical protein
LWVVLSLPASGAELSFKFDEAPINEPPPGFTNLLYGKGASGEWKVIMDDVKPLIEPATTKAPVVTRKPVLAQVSHDPTDERFPLLLYEKEQFDDFTLTTKFKIVEGVVEQLAGIVFRVQNETNFYVIRANSMDNTLRFYKVVNGLRAPMVGPKVEVPANVWHDLKIECKGNQIRAWLNGQEAIPLVTDSSYQVGRVGFWTKSDAISYFSDTTITYVPREPPAKALVQRTLKKYSRLKGLKLSTLDANGEPRVIASGNPAEVGTAATETEKQTIVDGTILYGADKSSSTVVMPLRDRNGEPIAAVSVLLERFPGQTERNAVIRATPILKEMQKGVHSLRELTEE